MMFVVKPTLFSSRLLYTCLCVISDGKFGIDASMQTKSKLGFRIASPRLNLY